MVPIPIPGQVQQPEVKQVLVPQKSEIDFKKIYDKFKLQLENLVKKNDNSKLLVDNLIELEKKVEMLHTALVANEKTIGGLDTKMFAELKEHIKSIMPK